MKNYLEHPSSGCRVSYATIRKAMKAADLTHYPMSLTAEAEGVIEAVNQGIDSHLEACNSPDLGDSYEHDPRIITLSNGTKASFGPRLNCEVSAESLPTLLRRLTEIEDEDGELSSLVSDILYTLGINDSGKFEGVLVD